MGKDLAAYMYHVSNSKIGWIHDMTVALLQPVPFVCFCIRAAAAAATVAASDGEMEVQPRDVATCFWQGSVAKLIERESTWNESKQLSFLMLAEILEGGMRAICVI